MTRHESRHNGAPTTDAADLRRIVGANIRGARDEQQLKNRDLADAVGIDVRLLQKHMRGDNMPGEDNLLRYARVLGKSVAWFFGDHKAAA